REPPALGPTELYLLKWEAISSSILPARPTKSLTFQTSSWLEKSAKPSTGRERAASLHWRPSNQASAAALAWFCGTHRFACRAPLRYAPACGTVSARGHK